MHYGENIMMLRIKSYLIKKTGLSTEREIWLIQTALIRDDSIFDHAFSNEQIWTFYAQGQSVEVRIEYSKKKEINGTTYNAVWDLLSLSLCPDVLDHLSTDALIALLEEALQIYGNEGVLLQTPDFTVALRDCRKDR